MLLEKVCFKPLRSKLDLEGVRRETQRSMFLVFTFGLSIFVQNILLALFGPQYRTFPFYIHGTTRLPYLVISNQRILILFFSMVLIIGLLFLLYGTKIGRAIRAVSQDADTASSLGVNVNKVYTWSVCICVTLAAAAGCLFAPLFKVFPAMGFPFSIKGVVIIILGGMASPLGALVGSFLLAMVETVITFIWTGQIAEAAGFLIITFVLLLKPSGLFAGDSK